ncbi:MAG TPA: hypothetical protein VM285_04425 [Polyangia bacterium]|nr:hypothetical protein [Polyangia bacterium]
MIPNDLWFRERRRYPWIADFLALVSLDEYRDGEPRPVAFYAAEFGANRKTIRRLMDERSSALEGGTATGQARDSDGTGAPSNSGQLAATRDMRGTATGQARDRKDRELETETETEETRAPAPRSRVPSEASEKAEPKTRKPPADWPNQQERETIAAWAAKLEQPVSRKQLAGALQVFANWVESRSKQDAKTRRGWNATFRNAVLKRWALTDERAPANEAFKTARPYAGSLAASGVDEARAQVEAEIAAHAKHRQPDPSCARCKFGAVLAPLLRSVS